MFITDGWAILFPGCLFKCRFTVVARMPGEFSLDWEGSDSNSGLVSLHLSCS